MTGCSFPQVIYGPSDLWPKFENKHIELELIYETGKMCEARSLLSERSATSLIRKMLTCSTDRYMNKTREMQFTWFPSQRRAET
jgi:hypothetical protein